MSDLEKSNGISLGMVVLIASIALNGLMAGYIIAKTNAPSPTVVERPQNAPKGGQDVGDARRIVRHLAPERRREILDTALKNLNVSADERPRALFQQRRLARRKSIEVATTEPLDPQAITKALADVRVINEKLAVQGDALILEVLLLMTPEERKQVAQSSGKRRGDDRRRRRPRDRD